MRPHRIKDRVKKIENDINIHGHDDHVVTFVESEDGETLKIKSMLASGKYKHYHIKTIKEAEDFFNTGTFNQIFLNDVPYDDDDPGHAVPGSVYEYICNLRQ